MARCAPLLTQCQWAEIKVRFLRLPQRSMTQLDGGRIVNPMKRVRFPYRPQLFKRYLLIANPGQSDVGADWNNGMFLRKVLKRPAKAEYRSPNCS